MNKFFGVWIIAILFLGVILTGLFGGDAVTKTTTVTMPVPNGYVNDLADVISAEKQAELEAALLLFAESGKGEIAVLTIETTSPDSIEQYGVKLASAWKVGSSEEDNGVVLILATKDRKVRIEVGYGAEAVLTDAQSGRILDNDVVPYLKSQNWEVGVTSGVSAIINELTN